MRRILSIILAAAMVLSLVPAVFAEGEATEPISVTYSFTNGGRSDVSDNWLEKVQETTDEETGSTTYSFLWNEKYKNFPTTSEEPGDYWAYLGTNAPAVSQSSIVALSDYLSINKCSWIAFRIKVPETAIYSIKELVARKYKNASKSMNISIAELTDDLRAIFTEGNVNTYGTAGIGSTGYGTRTGAKTYADLGIADKTTLLGKSNIFLASGAEGYFTNLLADITDAGVAVLKANTEYLLILHTEDSWAPTIKTLTLEGEKIEPTITTKLSVENLEIDESATLSSVVTDNSGEVVADASVTYTTEDTDIISLSGNTVTALASGTATVTATATVNGKVITTTVEVIVSVNRTPVYNFTSGAIADGSKKIENITDYSQLKPSVSTGKWKYIGGPNISNSSFTSSGLQFCSYKGSSTQGTGSLVLNLKVDASGLYNSVIEYVKQQYCGRIDMFVIPEALAEENEWDMTQYSGTSAAIAYCTDKDNAGHYMASIDMHTDSAETSPRNGNAVYLAKGDNYLLLRIKQGCGTSSHKDENYYGYVSSISFSPAETGLALGLNELTIRPSDRPAVIASGIDANGNAAEIKSITYESLDTSVATIDSATGIITPVKEGVARIEATATVGETPNVTAQIPVTVYTEWNPVFKTIKTAVKEESIQGSTIDCTLVTDYNYLDRSESTGLWKYETMFNFGTPVLYGTDLEFGISKAANLGKGNNALVLSAVVDATGVYNTSIGVTPNANGGIMDVYLVPKSYTEAKNFDVSTLENVNAIIADCEENEASEAKYIGRVDANLNVNPSTTSFDGATVKLSKGENYVIIVVSASEGATGNKDGRYWGMLRSITLDNTESIKVLANSSEIVKGEETTLQSVVRDEYYSVISDAAVTYESLTPSVATVSDNMVQGISVGDAAIRASATVGDVTVTDTVTIKVSEKTEDVTIVSYAYSIDGEKPEVRKDVRGTPVTVEAPAELENKVFRHWVLGTDENGIPVSESATYTFIALTNTYLTAVYSDAVPEGSKVVEFYLENGGFVGNAVANEEGKVTPPEKPSLTGYEVSAWMLDTKTEFTADTIVEDLLTKVVGVFLPDAITGSLSYGDEVKNETSSEKLWKRDGKVVAYGKSYTYYVWEESEIEAVDGEKPTKPIIVLDDKKKGTARMIEYDANGFEIVEAGILFGNGENMTVDSCMYKAKSNRNLSHGQFTAKPANDEHTTAIGYIVYVDNNKEYKVVYSE